MSMQDTATSVRRSIVVEASIERAFRVFTEDFGRFKPREHNMLGVEIAETVFEPRVGGDPKKTSEVEVRFVAETPRRTRVELEHRRLERHGAGWEGVREGVGGEDGWPRYLRAYAGLFARQASAQL
jgi:hypothetical protein